MPFPKDFIWGTAASHYQIEGGGTDHGRGLSTWDAIRQETGRIRDGSKPDESIGGYEKWKEDVQLIVATGVTHYRFSISWSRVLPSGTIENINKEGVEYYRRFIKELLKYNITPIITLFHFDWPLALFDRGGWLNSESQKWFIEFADLCFREYGNLVPIWMTFNEITYHVLSAVCKLEGENYHCPTRGPPKEADTSPFIASHNMIMAHGKAYRLYKEKYKEKYGGKVGLVTGGMCWPEGEDQETVYRARDFYLGWAIDPLFFGDYPISMREHLNGEHGKPKLPQFTEEEKKIITGATDFIALNYYVPRLVAPGQGRTLLERLGRFRDIENSWEKISGVSSWCRCYPDGLLNMFRFFRDKYSNIPVIVAENGCADIIGMGIHDDNRIRLISQHVEVIKTALKEGCNVIGYTVWCLMDNFEWDDGFETRFGMYRVDVNDLEKKRTPKKSVAYYRAIIEEYRGKK